VTREAYSHEVSSAGFWPGVAGLSEAAFYASAYPEPAGFAQAAVAPAAASYDSTFGEFLLPYEAVRQAAAPDDLLLEFLQSTYKGTVDLAGQPAPDQFGGCAHAVKDGRHRRTPSL